MDLSIFANISQIPSGDSGRRWLAASHKISYDWENEQSENCESTRILETSGNPEHP